MERREACCYYYCCWCYYFNVAVHTLPGMYPRVEQLVVGWVLTLLWGVSEWLWGGGEWGGGCCEGSEVLCVVVVLVYGLIGV